MLQQNKVAQVQLAIESSLDLINHKQLTSFIANLKRNSEGKTTKDKLIRALKLTVNQTFGPEKNIDPGIFIRTLSLIAQNIKITENLDENKIMSEWLLSFAALSIDELNTVFASIEFTSILNDKKFMNEFGVASDNRELCNAWYKKILKTYTSEYIIGLGMFGGIPSSSSDIYSANILKEIKDMFDFFYYSPYLGIKLFFPTLSVLKSSVKAFLSSYYPVSPITSLFFDSIIAKLLSDSETSIYKTVFVIPCITALYFLSIFFSPTIFAITCIACDLIAIGIRTHSLLKNYSCRFSLFGNALFQRRESEMIAVINKIDLFSSILASNTVCALLNVGMFYTMLVHAIPDIVNTLIQFYKIISFEGVFSSGEEVEEILIPPEKNHLLLEKIVSSNEKIDAEDIVDRVCEQILNFENKSKGEQDSIKSTVLSELFSIKEENAIYLPANDNYRNFLNRGINDDNNELREMRAQR